MAIAIQIGVYHEEGGRKVQRCPSYYAADWELLETEVLLLPMTMNLLQLSGHWQTMARVKNTFITIGD